MTFLIGGMAMADYRNNPFTFVYDGAITKNEEGKVNVEKVSYKRWSKRTSCRIICTKISRARICYNSF